MPGKPKARKRRESALLLGQETRRQQIAALAKRRNGKNGVTPAETKPAEAEQPSQAEVEGVPFTLKEEGKRGASPDWMRAMTKKRDEMAKTDPSKKGGRPRTKFSKAEIEARAIERMTPKALKVLDAQLRDETLSPRERREVAKLVLEHRMGKPTQKVESKVDARISAIRFETAAFMGIPDADLELPAADVTEEDAD